MAERKNRKQSVGGIFIPLSENISALYPRVKC